MKLSVPLLVAALASSTQALRLGYNAFSAANLGGSSFVAYMFIDGKNVAGAHREGGSSSWVQWGIHKIQLNKAQMYGFNYCIDVFGDVSCVWVNTGNPDCGFNPNNQRPECTTQWKDDNWGA
ncbi:hypothetical protein BGX24_008641 [Mortierella sp. AD032]|nr:hypothetical protein BGX24_008641 [Mortierella sp. AD032]